MAKANMKKNSTKSLLSSIFYRFKTVLQYSGYGAFQKTSQGETVLKPGELRRQAVTWFSWGAGLYSTLCLWSALSINFDLLLYFLIFAFLSFFAYQMWKLNPLPVTSSPKALEKQKSTIKSYYRWIPEMTIWYASNFLLGIFIALVLWGWIGDLMLSSAEGPAKKAGYSFQMDPAEEQDFSDENGITWLRMALAQKSIGGLNDSVDTGKKYGLTKTQSIYEILTNFLKNTAADRVVFPLSAKEAGILRRLLKENQKTLDLARQGSLCPRLTWGIDTGKPPYSIEVPRMANFLSLSRLLAIQAILDVQSHRPEEAIADIKAGFFLAKAASASHELIGTMIAVAASNTTLNAVQYVIRKNPSLISGDQLKEWAKSGELSKALMRNLEVELFYSPDYYANHGFYSNNQGFDGFEAAGWTLAMPILKMDFAKGIDWNKQEMDQLNKLGSQDSVDANMDLSCPQPFLFSFLSQPKWSQMLIKCLQNEANVRLAWLALAAQDFKAQNGRWPEKLEDLKSVGLDESNLKDPYVNGSMKLLVKKGRLILYSTNPWVAKDQQQVLPDDPKNWGVNAGPMVWVL